MDICCVCVPEDEIYVIERCGNFNKEAKPGYHCLYLPCVHSVAGKLSTRMTPLSVHVETKTMDNVFVILVVTIQYRVQKGKAYDAYYRLSEPQRQIRCHVYDVVRAAVPTWNIDQVFEVKDDLADRVREALRAQMHQYGFEIVNVLVVDVKPAEVVRNAMNAVNANKRLRQAAEYKAEAEKIRVVKEAEATAQSHYLQGVGVARQRKAIVDGISTSLLKFREQTKADTKQVMDLVLATQYFDMLKEVAKGSQTQTIFIQDDGKDEQAERFRDAILSAQAAAP